MSETPMDEIQEIQTGDATPDETEPVTDYRSKMVMLRAERNDIIELTKSHAGGWDWPKRYTVVQRTETYFGPRLTLDPEDAEKVTNYRLTCPGPDTHLLLWRAVLNEDNGIETWIKAAEVEAEIAETKQYKLCEHCDEPLKTLEHERLAMFGACSRPGIDDPNRRSGTY